MKNHVIPKMILKRFVDEDERFWFYRKPKTDSVSAPKRIQYAKTFIRTDIYDPETESHLSHLEGKVDMLVNRIQQRKYRGLNTNDRIDLCTFLGIQALRSERAIHQMTNDDQIDRYMRETRSLFRPRREDFRRVVLRMLKGMLNGGFHNWIHPKNPEYGQLTERDLQIIAIPDEVSRTFVIGDSVAIIYLRRPSPIHLEYSNKFIDPNIVKIMPVTPKIAIALYKDSNGLDVGADVLVEAINRDIFNQSLSIAACKKGIIENLLSTAGTKKTCEETLEDSEYRCFIDG